MLTSTLRVRSSSVSLQARSLCVQSSDVFDVAIVGAGMVGTALAAALGEPIPGNYKAMERAGFLGQIDELVCRQQSSDCFDENSASG